LDEALKGREDNINRISVFRLMCFINKTHEWLIEFFIEMLWYKAWLKEDTPFLRSIALVTIPV
jgi:hypothetical protein